MMTALTVNAKSELKNEIAVSYGAVANSNFADVFTEAFTTESGSYFGPMAIEYLHHLSPLISIGAVGVYKNHKVTFQGSEISNSYITVMPAVKFSWYTSKCFGFYSKLCAGYTFFSVSGETKDMEDKENSGCFNFQASLVGLELGSQHVRGFAELGWGEQGLVCGGIRFKF